MFLDEKLLKMVMDSDLDTDSEIQKVFSELCIECELQYKRNLNINSSDKQIKASIDRVFNAWDSFIRMGEKVNNISKVMFIEVIKKHSFKSQFLNNSELKRIYESL